MCDKHNTDKAQHTYHTTKAEKGLSAHISSVVPLLLYSWWHSKWQCQITCTCQKMSNGTFARTSFTSYKIMWERVVSKTESLKKITSLSPDFTLIWITLTPKGFDAQQTALRKRTKTVSLAKSKIAFPKHLSERKPVNPSAWHLNAICCKFALLWRQY